MTWSTRLRFATVDEIPLVVAIDDDAAGSYAAVGLHLDFGPGHPFVAAERARWTAAARAQRLLLACSEEGEPVGFAILDVVDGRPTSISCRSDARGSARGSAGRSSRAHRRGVLQPASSG